MTLFLMKGKLLFYYVYLAINIWIYFFVYNICNKYFTFYILYFIRFKFKSRNTIYDTIKDLSNIIYNSNFYEFTQIFLGKYYLNIILFLE